MSRRDRRPEALVLDEGVLREGAVCEFGSDLAVEARGGLVVTPWRDRYRAAEAAELPVAPDAAEVESAAYSQVIVHLQKSRAATFGDLAEAWRLLAPGGQLLFAGTNALGVTSAVKKLATQLDQTPIVVTNRARSRVVRFKRDAGAGPERESTPSFDGVIEGIDGTPHPFSIETCPGVFSAKKLDAGSQLLLETLPAYVGYKAPKRVVDLGCGTGVLGLAAATLYESTEVLLVDGDARAVACAQANAERMGLASRCRTAWWDAREAPPEDRFDLALVNPPFHHRGPEVDLGPALAFFDSLKTWLGRNGRALIVANRTLPWEGPLDEIGDVETLASTRGYKLLALKKGSPRRSARSSSVRGRSAPASRSGGRSKSPTRSR